MFRTVQDNKKSIYTFGNLILLLMALTVLAVVVLLLLSLLPQMFRVKDELREMTIPLNIALVLLIFLSAINYILFRGKSGKLSGTLDLKEDSIVLNEEIIPLSDIEKIRIIGNDIKGEFRGFLSKGANNKLMINLLNGSKKEIAFEQTKENTLRSQKDVLKIYHDSGKLTESNYQNILNNTNYY